MVSTGMRLRYSQAVLSFLVFLADADLAATRTSQLCDAAARWVEYLYADGQRKGLASDGLAGLQYFWPQCQGKLKQAWKLVKVWQRVGPPMRVLPLSPLLVLGMAGMAAALRLPEIAAGLLVCFDGILRSGELYQLRVSDVTFYGSKASAAARLHKSKRSEQMVLTCGPEFFRNCFKFFLSESHLSAFNINVFYSLRRGGATWDFLSYQSMERTLLRGRWASTSSARVYLQDAVATIAHLRLEEKVSRPAIQVTVDTGKVAAPLEDEASSLGFSVKLSGFAKGP
ncbi:hypothetical protein AK812_SmicGene23459 [Symbiodinium microadriaticum]|uniref:Tyr recombinase domain-containing protein n=1 Tax=Symbiodinium microadriaticum TaxID=2951 RepID=A0A1Q9DH87_SYMMI|nr:hypothetical protein AK812_SmicGene23459 [Symbiodinium microadriaticum]